MGTHVQEVTICGRLSRDGDRSDKDSLRKITCWLCNAIALGRIQVLEFTKYARKVTTVHFNGRALSTDLFNLFSCSFGCTRLWSLSNPCYIFYIQIPRLHSCIKFTDINQRCSLSCIVPFCNCDVTSRRTIAEKYFFFVPSYSTSNCGKKMIRRS